MVNWLNSLFSRSEKVLIIDGVRIPPAYIPLNTWIQEHPDETPPAGSIRYFHTKYAFVFDQDNFEYQAFYQQCKADSNALRKALSSELKKRTLPILGSQTPLSASKKKSHWKVSILIRPLHFTSSNEKTDDDRWQGEGLSFVFHYDENHTLQHVRINTKSDSDAEERFKIEIGNDAKRSAVQFQQVYGNWELFAKIFVDILERRILTLCPDYLSRAA